VFDNRCWLVLYGVRNTVVVAIEIPEIVDAITIGINGRCGQLIPHTVTSGVGEPSGCCFGC